MSFPVFLILSSALFAESLTPQMASYLQDELLSDALVMEEINPKAFDYEPEEVKNSGEVDFASVKFIAKILYANGNRESIAVAEELSDADEVEETVDQPEEILIPAAHSTSEGRQQEYEKPLNVMMKEGDRETITHFPQSAILAPYERGEYASVDKPFYIARHPVTNREWKKFIKATGRTAPAYWPKDKMTAAFKDESVVNISHQEAEDYAAWMKQRLPSLGEMERAERSYPALRRNSPVREWTSTPAKELDGFFLVIGGGELKADVHDQQTGFRLARDTDP